MVKKVESTMSFRERAAQGSKHEANHSLLSYGKQRGRKQTEVHRFPGGTAKGHRWVTTPLTKPTTYHQSDTGFVDCRKSNETPPKSPTTLTQAPAPQAFCHARRACECFSDLPGLALTPRAHYNRWRAELWGYRDFGSALPPGDGVSV